MNTPKLLPLPILYSDFEILGSLLEADVEKKFGRMLQRLHGFLNDDPATRDLRADRKCWKPRARREPSFGSFGFQDGHWYTFNNGGRNEAQLNVGMFGEHKHVRIGLGFERTPRHGGDPRTVDLVYTAFVSTLQSQGEVKRDFVEFINTEKLEVEIWRPETGALEILPTAEVLETLLKPKEFSWIFVGKMLRPESDATILENPNLFASTLHRILARARPMWRRINMLGLSLE